MTPASSSKQDKDDLCEFIYCVQRTFILLSHECYFPRTCIRLCLVCFNVHCMCAYMIVCVFVCVCIGVDLCVLLVHVHVCLNVSGCICVSMCMFV